MLKTLRFTKLLKEGALHPAIQRDEDFTIESSKGAYPFPWTGESILNSKKGCSEHFDSWKIKDDLRIHPIDDVGPIKSKMSCTDGGDNFKSKPR